MRFLFVIVVQKGNLKIASPPMVNLPPLQKNKRSVEMIHSCWNRWIVANMQQIRSSYEAEIFAEKVRQLNEFTKKLSKNNFM